jgi:hypothetical protein
MSFRLFRDLKADTNSSISHDKIPTLDITISTPLKGLFVYNVSDDNLYYADGDRWLPVSNSSRKTEVGYLGLKFSSFQPVPPDTPTTVQFDHSYDDNFPPHPSFVTSETKYGFEIVSSGVYAINYQLGITNTDLNKNGAPVAYQTLIQINIPNEKIQNIGATVTPGSFSVQTDHGSSLIVAPKSGISIQGYYISFLSAGALVTIQTQHDSVKSTEKIYGPYNGDKQDFPDHYPTYFQIEKLS